MKTPSFARGPRIAAVSVLAMAVLAGCTTNQFAARVTTFQQWPSDAAGQSYRFTPLPAEKITLEYQSYQELLRASLRGIGLVEAQPWARDARFTVSFSYGIMPFQTWDDVPAPFYGGPAFSYGYFGNHGPGFGWGYNMMFPFGGYGPAYAAVPVTAYRNTLDVAIRDNAHGNIEVFQARASHDSGPDAMPRAMPYLVQAIFQDFPNGNGQVRTVTIPLQR